MGPRSSKTPEINFLNQYQIIQQIKSQNSTLLQHRQTKDEYLLKQFNFNDKKQCQQKMEKLSELRIKLSGNKHVVPLKDYIMSSEDQYCSTFYKIYALFQYPQRTLDDEINQRKLHRKVFSQTQLWSILASCIVGLSHLQKNGIKHSALKSSNILLSKQGIIRITDPSSLGQSSNYESILTKRQTQHIYLSPEQTYSLQQQITNPSYNPFKSDIWTLGMIIIEAGLLQYQDQQCYRDQKSRIHWQTVQYNIDRLGQAYSSQIKNMIEFMLSKDERARPDWIDLQQHVMKGDEARKSYIKSQIENPSRSFVQDKSNILNSQRPRTNSFNNTNVNPNVASSHFPTLGNKNPINYIPPQQNVVFHYQNQPAQIPYHSIPLSNNSFAQYSARGDPIQPNYSIIHPNPINNNHNYLIHSNVIVPNMQYKVGQTLPSAVGLNPNQPPYVLNNVPTVTANLSSSQINVLPLKVSIIDHTRPLRNIFPKDSYTTKTKFDENLVIMNQDQEEVNYNTQREQNRQNANKLNNNSQALNNQKNLMNYFNSSQQKKYIYNEVKPNNHNNQNKQRDTNQNDYRLNNITNNNNVMNQYNNNQMEGPDQEPKFVTEKFNMGSKYQGWKVNGLRHGYGRFYYQDGGMYDGQWKQNKMQGFGKLYYQSGKLAYEGQWKNDQFTGKGILYNQVPDIIETNFNYNDFDDVDDYWTKYQGQFQDDMKNGKGILYISNGQKFDGYFVADSVQGLGTYFCKNGTKIFGKWEGNKKIQ